MVAEISPLDRPEAAPRLASGRPSKDAQKSRITNGSALLPDIDGRSVIARRYRDIMSALLTDQGGASQCSESRTQLIRRFAAASVLAEQMEAKLVNGEQIDLAEHAQLASTLVRLTNHLGLDRVPRDVSPYVSEVIDGHTTSASEAGWSPLRDRFAAEVLPETEAAK